jgi:hypothetical protein
MNLNDVYRWAINVQESAQRMTKEPLIDRAKEAFAAYHGLGREIIDELIFALTRANAEVDSLRASQARLLAAAKDAYGTLREYGLDDIADDLETAIAAEEPAP